ncbi:hypothetical protein ACFE04_017141 [Oxalis oulophora]
MDSPPPPAPPKHNISNSTSDEPPLEEIESPPVKESPFSNFVSNLSPILHKPPSHTLQLQPHHSLPLNSPPIVFASPRIATLNQSILFQRPNLSNQESPHHDNCNHVKDNSDARLGAHLIANALHEDHTLNPHQLQPSSSSSACVDDYLADPLDLDSANSEKDHKHSQENAITHVKLVRNNNDQRLGDWLPSECTITDNTEFCAENVIKNQQHPSTLEAENVGGGHLKEYDRSPDFRCRPLQTSRTHEIYGEDIEEISNGPVTQRMCNREASPNQRGVSRRCLQFEGSQPSYSIKRPISSDLPSNETGVFERLNSSDADVRTPLPVSKPLVIGLHLNSIINSVSVGQSSNTNMKLAKGHMIVKQTNSVTIMASHPEVNLNNEKVSIIDEDWVSETRPNTAESSPSAGSFQIMGNVNLHGERIFNSESADEDFDQQRHQNKRKKTSGTNNANGCKRCNCKKSKCLKLYCDCFAAGVYCDDSCTCQGCFNKLECHEKVREAKQQIETRNPMAFAPKIVPTEFAKSSEEHANQYTPSSARHKSGCNCKKSKCLKKYCECYQANVGCSIGCRCEGCKNVYGRKTEYVAIRELASKSSSENKYEAFDERLERVARRKVVLQAEIYEAPNHTPHTTSFSCLDLEKDLKSRFVSRRNLPSPGSELDVFSYIKSPASPKSSDKNKILDTNKENLEGDSYCQTMDDNILNMDQFLPKKFPSMAIGSAVSSKNNSRKGTHIQLGPGNGCLSSGGALRWHSSSVTPATDRLGELCDFLKDSPEMLKNDSTAINSVKVCSPKEKRVSPPHIQGHEVGSSSLGPPKSGRRFILKALAFPPLTRCVDSKGSIYQSTSELPEKVATSGEDKPM